MIVIALLIVIFLAVHLTSSKQKDNGTTATVVVREKHCPPHQWYWQEILDQDGNKQGETIACKLCGPLSKRIDGSIE